MFRRLTRKKYPGYEVDTAHVYFCRFAKLLNSGFVAAVQFKGNTLLHIQGFMKIENKLKKLLILKTNIL